MRLYLIPGYGESVKNRGYRRIISEAEEKGYEVKVLNLQLNKGGMADAVSEALETIGNDLECTLFGFSTGALIAYCISKKISVKKAIFCSISPLLGEDVPQNSKIYNTYFGEKIVNEFKKLKYGKSKAQEKLFLYGSKEGRKLIGRTKELQRVNGGELIKIPNNDHVLNSTYVRRILELI
jgi:hypothetical protein